MALGSEAPRLTPTERDVLAAIELAARGRGVAILEDVTRQLPAGVSAQVAERAYASLEDGGFVKRWTGGGLCYFDLGSPADRPTGPILAEVERHVRDAAAASGAGSDDGLREVEAHLNNALAHWQDGEYGQAMEQAAVARMRWEDAGSPAFPDDDA